MRCSGRLALWSPTALQIVEDMKRTGFRAHGSDLEPGLRISNFPLAMVTRWLFLESFELR